MDNFENDSQSESGDECSYTDRQNTSFTSTSSDGNYTYQQRTDCVNTSFNSIDSDSNYTYQQRTDCQNTRFSSTDSDVNYTYQQGTQITLPTQSLNTSYESESNLVGVMSGDDEDDDDDDEVVTNDNDDDDDDGGGDDDNEDNDHYYNEVVVTTDDNNCYEDGNNNPNNYQNELVNNFSNQFYNKHMDEDNDNDCFEDLTVKRFNMTKYSESPVHVKAIENNGRIGLKIIRNKNAPIIKKHKQDILEANAVENKEIFVYVNSLENNSKRMRPNDELENEEYVTEQITDSNPVADGSYEQMHVKRMKVSENKEIPVSSTTEQHERYGLKIMKQMGFKEGTGMGKTEQGILEPIIESSHKGRRGLGHESTGLDRAANKYIDQVNDDSIGTEKINWLEYKTYPMHSNDADALDDMDDQALMEGVFVGKKKNHIDDETTFCQAEILKELLDSKSVFDSLGENDMRNARSRSNPYETIRNGIFQNRAAIKMANLDAIFGQMFTNPLDEQNRPMVKINELLYFADICAGPGGFSEYILYRKGWNAKGFGFTLRGANDFRLDQFLAGPPETFDPYYGVDGDGDIFKPTNIKSLTEYVLKQTDDMGVHIMMADGGFSVEKNENIQEILSKQLYLCQCLVGLKIIRENGHMVVKLFDLFTEFSVGIVYFMYRCFKQICIVKPVTSRPANSERYLVCKWKRSNTNKIAVFLNDINRAMYDENIKNTNDADTLTIVNLDIMRKDKHFFDYIVNSNNELGRKQIDALLKIAAYAQNTELKDERQSDVREKCLKLWKIPNGMRTKFKPIPCDRFCASLLDKWNNEREFMNSTEKELTGELYTKKILEKIFQNIDQWHFVPIDVPENCNKSIRTFFMSQGHLHVSMLVKEHWVPVSDISIELSPKTLIYGEIVKEYSGIGKSQTIVYALHIIDGLILGGIDIRSLPFTERLKKCDAFARALYKPRRNINNNNNNNNIYNNNVVDTNRVASTSSCQQNRLTFVDTPVALAPIRAKKPYLLKDLSNFFHSMDTYTMKERSMNRFGIRLTNPIDRDRYYVPHGLLFFNQLKGNLTKHKSNTSGKYYYYDCVKDTTFYAETLTDPKTIYASFKTTFPSRYKWTWEEFPQVEEFPMNKSPNLLHRDDFERFINFAIENQRF